MTVKEWLTKGRKLNDEIESLKESKKRAFDLACGTLIDTGNERVQTSTENATERKFTEYVDYSVKLDRKIAELFQCNTKMQDLINKLDDTRYRALLTGYYINCETWERLAEKLEKDITTIYRWRDKAMEELEEVFNPF